MEIPSIASSSARCRKVLEMEVHPTSVADAARQQRVVKGRFIRVVVEGLRWGGVFMIRVAMEVGGRPDG